MLDNDSDASDGQREKQYWTINPGYDYSAPAWGTMLRDPGVNEPTSRASKLFRKPFRLPYSGFLELVKLVNRRPWFSTRKENVACRRCIPVEMKLRMV